MEDQIKSKQRRIVPRACAISARKLRPSTLTIGTALCLLEIRNPKEGTAKARLAEKEVGNRLS